MQTRLTANWGPSLGTSKMKLSGWTLLGRCWTARPRWSWTNASVHSSHPRDNVASERPRKVASGCRKHMRTESVMANQSRMMPEEGTALNHQYGAARQILASYTSELAKCSSLADCSPKCRYIWPMSCRPVCGVSGAQHAGRSGDRVCLVMD